MSRRADICRMTGHIPTHLPRDGAPGDLTQGDLEALGRSLLFRGCPAEVLDRVGRFAFVTHLPHGAILLQPGESNRYVYVLVEGQLAAFLDPGLAKRVARFVPGDALGEHALVGPDGGTTYVVAQWPSRLVALDAGPLREIMEVAPRIALNALDMLGARLRAANLRHDPREAANIDFMASRDAVTGVHNRRWMESAFAAEIARCSQAGEPSLRLAVIERQIRLSNGGPLQRAPAIGSPIISNNSADLSEFMAPRLRPCRYSLGRAAFGSVVQYP